MNTLSNEIRFVSYPDVDCFLKENEELLLREESAYNKILGLCHSIQEGSLSADGAIFLSFHSGQGVLGQAVRPNRRYPLMLTALPFEAVDLCCRLLISQEVELDGVLGPAEPSSSFTELWGQRRALEVRLTMDMSVCELTQVQMPSSVHQGQMIQASSEHLPFCREWAVGFVEVCFPKELRDVQKAHKMIDAYVEQGKLFLWKDRHEGFVSMASRTRESRHCTTISLVFTPAALRDRGYAQNLVASLSQMLLQQGRRACNLFFDLANPYSGPMYQKIGYRPLGRHTHYSFYLPAYIERL